VPVDTLVRVDDPVGGGAMSQHVHRDVGDFVLKRGDGLFSYQLAVAIDDSEMGVTHVVRGRDLLASTPRQRLLLELLGMRAPHTYIHVPLVLNSEGERLEKRTQGSRVRALRKANVSADEVLGELAYGLGIAQAPSAQSLEALCTSAEARTIEWSKSPFRIPTRWKDLDPRPGSQARESA
jgi:glutamyl-tRNA synthetase